MLFLTAVHIVGQDYVARKAVTVECFDAPIMPGVLIIKAILAVSLIGTVMAINLICIVILCINLPALTIIVASFSFALIQRLSPSNLPQHLPSIQA